MKDIDSAVMLKEKLLIAGIDEIMAHGTVDFSLRRVAAACGASCAAPYKHFKNKEEFIRETIMYVEEKWNHLADQIISSVDEPAERIARLCIANVRFKVANPLYGMAGETFDYKITHQVQSLYASPESAPCLSALFGISALTSGTAALMSEGKLENCPESFDMLRKKILEEISRRE